MKTQEKPATTISLEFKKIVLKPCLKALAITALTQTLILAVFIAIVNINIFHPINWILKLFGFHWLKHVPLLAALLVNGFILSKESLLHPRKYYANRFKWILDKGMSKIVLLSTEMLFGLLTAWSFMSYLNIPFFIQRNGTTSINPRYTFLTLMGIAAGCYYFVRHHLKNEILLNFEFIPKTIIIRLRESIQECFWLSARNAILPTVSFSLFYWIFGSMLNRRLALLFSVAVDNSLDSFFYIFTNFNLLFIAWLIILEIFTVMSLMEHTFSLFLTTQYCFPIGADLPMMDAKRHVTLVTALSLNDFPVLQNLAAQDFYNLTKMKSPERRKEIFTLSQPGGHPYNWTQLSGQCLSIINAFIDELNSSLKYHPGTIQTATLSISNNNGIQMSAKEIAQRALIQQYNEKHNIRRLRSEIHPFEEKSSQPISTVARINENFNRTIEEIIQRVVKTFQSLPGIFYLFGEPEGSKLSYLLANADLLIWITQGMAYICAASLNEDPYGVVQVTLPEIMKTLLKFKAELDRLSTINLNSKKLDPNLIALRNALKRSLYKICNAFADYLPEIANDPNDLPFLRTFLYESSRC